MIIDINRQLEEAMTNFFCATAHGSAEHRAWFRNEFERFWGFKMPEDRVAPFLVERQPPGKWIEA